MDESIKKELEIMDKAWGDLKDLEWEARKRVVDWLSSKSFAEMNKVNSAKDPHDITITLPTMPSCE